MKLNSHCKHTLYCAQASVNAELKDKEGFKAKSVMQKLIL